MKIMVHGGNKLRRGVSLLLIMSMLIVLLPTVSTAATTGVYGSCTVTASNVVIRSSPAGSRTGYFAQKGTYPMIGPVTTVDGVNWYNIQTSYTAGYVSGNYATASYGTAGMPATSKTYVDILYDTIVLTKGSDPANPTLDASTSLPITATNLKGTLVQLVNGDSPYTAKAAGATEASSFINVYYNYEVYHTPYTNAFTDGLMSEANLDDYISGITWKQTTADPRNSTAKGDYLTHALQAALYILDYYDDTIDGSYGANTSAAVIEYKKDMNKAYNYGWTENDVMGSVCYKDLFAQALDRLDYLRTTNGLGTSTPTTTTTMVQTTVENLRIRKSYSSSSTYIGMIPATGTILTYTRTYVSGSVTWYYIQYNGIYGWVMGTYVTLYTAPTGTTTTTTTITNYGSVTITKNLVAIRKTANGSRTGYHVNKGDVCTMIGPATEAGGYTWYHIRTENGRTGYVRGDCADANFDSSAGMPKTTKSYVQFLYADMKATLGNTPPTSNTPVDVPQNTVLQLATGVSYKVSDVEYINVYFNNDIYYTQYTNSLTNGLMTSDNLNNYIINTIWAQGLPSGNVAGNGAAYAYHTRSIYVHAIQAALYQLGFMTDKDTFDGSFGTVTAAAVKAFKKAYNFTTVDEIIDTSDSITLFTAAAAALKAKLIAASTDTGDGTVLSAGDFGTVNTVIKGSWSAIDGGATSLFPKGSVAYVMSVKTKQVFRLYRWSGANHADCVPYDTSDTATLCSVLGMTYNSASPTSSELALVKASGTQDWPDYTWPKMRWAGSTLANAYKIPVWVNLNGTVYCASIYAIPHGFTGSSSFSLSKLNGSYFYERNNTYGMLCVHFYGSTTHASGKVDPEHNSNISYAYNQAASYFGSSKVK